MSHARKRAAILASIDARPGMDLRVSTETADREAKRRADAPAVPDAVLDRVAGRVSDDTPAAQRMPALERAAAGETRPLGRSTTQRTQILRGGARGQTYTPTAQHVLSAPVDADLRTRARGPVDADRDRAIRAAAGERVVNAARRERDRMPAEQFVGHRFAAGDAV